GDRSEIYNACADDSRQWFDVSGTSLHPYTTLFRSCSNADRQRGCGGTNDHDATWRPDGDCRTDGELRSSSEWDRAAELSMAEEWRRHPRGDLSELYNACNDARRRWFDVSGSREQLG